MLMTVLKGELAIKQSKALIRTIKKMKDYIIGNQSLIGQQEVIKASLKIEYCNNIHIGRHPDDKPTIGLLLVKGKNKTVVE